MTEMPERAYQRQSERVRDKVEGQYGPYTNADWQDVTTLYTALRAAEARIATLTAEREALKDAMRAVEDWLGLHREAELWYTVDGYAIDLTAHDGATTVHHIEGETLLQAFLAARALLAKEAP